MTAKVVERCFYCTGHNPDPAFALAVDPNVRCALCEWRRQPCPADVNEFPDSKYPRFKEECGQCIREYVEDVRRLGIAAAEKEQS